MANDVGVSDFLCSGSWCKSFICLFSQRLGVTVAGDLLFGAALWCCVADDQRLQPRGRYDNTFQPVRRLGGLHHRDLAQALEIGRASVGKECVSTCRDRWWPYHNKKKKKHIKT